jgi:hypothetical protein
VGSIAIEILAKRGYHVVALTGKEAETGYLKGLGAAEVMLRQSLDLAKIKPLGKETWAGAVDNLGGDVLAWMASTMKVGGDAGLDRPGCQPCPQHHGHALHPARREPARDRLGELSDGAARGRLAAPGDRHATGAPRTGIEARWCAKLPSIICPPRSMTICRDGSRGVS